MQILLLVHQTKMTKLGAGFYSITNKLTVYKVKRKDSPKVCEMIGLKLFLVSRQTPSMQL